MLLVHGPPPALMREGLRLCFGFRDSWSPILDLPASCVTSAALSHSVVSNSLGPMDPGIEPLSLASPALQAGFLPTREALVAQTVKHLPAVQEPGFDPWVGEDPLEKGTATHSSILAWRIPMDSPRGHKESDTTE